jgi:hypothetical protein
MLVTGSLRRSADIRPGNSMPLANIPVGTTIHNIELQPGKGGQMVRSAGTSAQLLAKEGRYAQVRLPSGEVRLVLQTCRASIGQVGNIEHGNIKLGKAGRKRHMGWRPAVRGLRCPPATIRMAVVKAAHRSVCPVRRALGVNPPWARRPGTINEPINISFAIALKRNGVVSNRLL